MKKDAVRKEREQRRKERDLVRRKQKEEMLKRRQKEKDEAAKRKLKEKEELVKRKPNDRDEAKDRERVMNKFFKIHILLFICFKFCLESF